MAEGGKKIERLKKGDKTRTAMHADVMNEIIDAVNALYAMQVSPIGAGKFIFSDSNAVLQIGTGETVDLDVCVDGNTKTYRFLTLGEITAS